ncbi:MAG: phenylalanine--tRNA ligase subunit beta [Blastocatellia bacterium]|nr:phenylalanine--tRNA ligase subunit beta [Blastocatellia bacterium]
MKISYNWLKEFVQIDINPRELAEKLTMVGLAVDSVEPFEDDFIFEFDLTSNRPDALSHFGIAREVATITGKKAILPPPKLKEASERTAAVSSVEILNPELCPRYVARVIKGVKIGPSPDWLVKKLERVGQRSINNIADITNLVLWEQGHPLHAFDLDHLAGKRIVVRTARKGETLITLDGVERKLREDMLVIADAEKPSALAGIMGGEYSEISTQTENVLLESAYFVPQSIRRTAKLLEMATEASYRFERGTDPEACIRAANRCTELILDLAGGTLLSGVLDVYPSPIKKTPIELRSSRITALTGLVVNSDTVESILSNLGCEVDPVFRSERWNVTSPSYRIDINIEEDLVEEVARHVGYDTISLNLPEWSGSGNYLSNEERRRKLRDTLTSIGYYEAVSFSWVRPEVDKQFRDHSNVIKIANPIDEERGQMRSSLLPGLLDGLLRNFSFGIRNVKLFEIGKCFQSAGEDSGYERPIEHERLAILATGQDNEYNWRQNSQQLDFYDIKGVIESLLENCGIKDYKFQSENFSYLHPGQSAQISVGGSQIGLLGQLAPAIQEEFKVKQQIFVAELDLDFLFSLASISLKYSPLPKLQSVSRDISVLISKSVKYQEIVGAIEALALPELVSVRLFDVYAGKNLPEDKQSLSLNLRYQPGAESMTDEQINRLDEQIVNLLASKFDAQLRR